MKLEAFIQKKPEISSEVFYRWWLDNAAALKRGTGVRDFRLSFIERTWASDVFLASVTYDALVELWLDDTARADLSSADMVSSRRVEFRVEEHVVVEGPPSGKAELLKSVSLLKRTPEQSRAEFHDWLLQHTEFSKQVPRQLGHQVGLIQAVQGRGYDPDDVDFDSSYTQWFSSMDDMVAAYEDPDARRVMTDLQAHCAARARYFVAEQVVKE